MKFTKMIIATCAIFLISPLNIFASNNEIMTISNNEEVMPISTEVQETLPVQNTNTEATDKLGLTEEDSTYIMLALLAIVLVGIGVQAGKKKTKKETVENKEENKKEETNETLEVSEENREDIEEVTEEKEDNK